MLAALNDALIRLDPSLILDEIGFDDPLAEPEGWQRRLLRSDSERMLLLTHRQAGKSSATAGLAIGTALHTPGSLILIVSPSGRQSGELFRKIVRAYERLGSPVPAVEDNAVTLALANGSRIVSLPDSPDTIVGYSGPRLVIIDEAARTSDEAFYCVTPMLLRSRGRLVCMSTPYGRRGWFHQQWEDRETAWERIIYRASENPKLDPSFLAEERKMKGPRWYAQEYECEFHDTVGQVFTSASIDAAFANDLQPLFSGEA
jgi:hypothetical protein